MNAKEFLNRAKFMNIRIKRLIADLDYWRELSMKLSSGGLEINYNQNKPTEAAFVKPLESLIEMEDKIDAKLAELLQVHHEITSTIETLDKVEEQLILTSRYLNNKTWEEISADLHLSQRSVFRIHKTALEKISRFLKSRQSMAVNIR